MLLLVFPFPKRSQGQARPTQRALDAGDSLYISSSFPRLSFLRSEGVPPVRPSASNADRWAAPRNSVA